MDDIKILPMSLPSVLFDVQKVLWLFSGDQNHLAPLEEVPWQTRVQDNIYLTFA